MGLAKIAPYYKAVAALLIALLTGLVSGLVDDGLSWTEILTAIIAMLVAGGTVFAVPNIPTATTTTPAAK